MPKWDDLLPNPMSRRREVNPSTQQGDQGMLKDFDPFNTDYTHDPAKPRNYSNEIESIGRRGLFGVITGGITGASFGAVEVVRDLKLMRAEKRIAIAKVSTFASRFAAFFGSYHVVRRTLKLYAPTSYDVNVALSAALTISPLIFMPKYRGLIPYSIFLVGLDYINSMNDK